MARGIIGKKLGMTQVFDQNGDMIAATVLEVGPNQIIQLKREGGKDGYNAIKLGFGAARPGRINKPELGVFKAANLEPNRYVQEFRVDAAELDGLEVGGTLGADLFTEGDLVDVVGTSKGRGFQGVIKRHHFKGAKEKTHGTHEYKRHGGSIGCSAYPGRVIKGKKMAGQMGNKRVSSLGLTVVGVYPEDNVIVVKGAVPGAKQSLVRIQTSYKA